jgi:hypothetical protein
MPVKLIDKAISETHDYYLKYFTGSEDPRENAYVIINKRTGIYEIISSILPQALKYLNDVQASLDAQRDIETMISESDSKSPPDNVTSLSDFKESK